MGWLFAHAGAAGGWRQHPRQPRLARPDLTAREVRHLTRAVPENAGRSLAEIYSGTEFTDRIHADRHPDRALTCRRWSRPRRPAGR